MLLAALLSACATLRSYDVELTRTLDLAGHGAIDQAMAVYDGYNRRARKDLLYYLEKGELLRLAHRFADSQTAWLMAEQRVQMWEDTARAHPERLLRDLGSILVNDRLRPYEGADFEKVMLSARMALNHLALGEWDKARVAVKRAHEREAVIASLRARQVLEAEEQARKHGARPSFKELDGYPVETIDNPEVLALKNSYQSAFSHYLAGFIYEALGEPSLAAAGYRQAIELRPGIALLERSLEGLDARVLDHRSDLAELLIVVESGSAPARDSANFNLPVFTEYGVALAPVSVPVIRPGDAATSVRALTVDGRDLGEPPVITSIDLMSRRQLHDDMPWILLRAFVRATGKVALQRQALKRDDSGLAGALVMIGAVLTEQADERGWRTLPATISVARTSVTPGDHLLTVDTGAGRHEFPVNVQGRYALACIRMLGSQVYLVSPAAPSGRQPKARASAMGLGLR
ncbi:MAG TPA: hypothetical protein VNM24_13380 [Burkholderiales bacterium]|nr:hypothetical protein [Burkholderiales bacterium]